MIYFLKIILLLAFYGISSAQSVNKQLYVKKEVENLRDSPNGNKIAQVIQKTKLNVIDEQGNWVKVQLTGWIYKSSLTENISSIKEKSIEDLTPAGSGFYFKNVSVKSGTLGVELLGEMVNKSRNNYKIANFVVSIYDSAGRLIETSYIIISNIPTGTTKSFKTFLTASKIDNISKYKIQFENGI